MEMTGKYLLVMKPNDEPRQGTDQKKAARMGVCTEIQKHTCAATHKPDQPPYQSIVGLTTRCANASREMVQGWERELLEAEEPVRDVFPHTAAREMFAVCSLAPSMYIPGTFGLLGALFSQSRW